MQPNVDYDSIEKKTKKRFVMVIAFVYLFSLQSNFLLLIPGTSFAFFTGEETTQGTGQEQVLTTGDGVDIVTTDSAFSGGLATSSGSDISGIGTSGETNVNLVTTGSSSCPSGGSLSGDVAINGTTTDSTGCLAGDVFSGTNTSSGANTISGANSNSGDQLSTPNSGENSLLTGTDADITTGSTDSGTGTATLSGQNTTTGYFTTQYASGAYDPKIIDLQKILQNLHLFPGRINGIYDQMTIESVTQYQLSHNLIDLLNAEGEIQGFLGPKTREAFNYEYIVYKQSFLNQLAKDNLPTHASNYVYREDRPQQIQDSKEYFLANEYIKKDLFGFGVFVGKKDIDFFRLRGRVDLPLIFQSTNTIDGNSAEVLFVEGTVLKTENGAVFTGTLASPVFLDPSVADELTGQDIVSVLDVGGNDEKILLENGSGEEVSSMVKIPVPGQVEGALLDINYSNDGKTWTYMASQKVFLENGEPYVQFETNHFTLFSVGLPVGTFYINDNAVRAYSINVTLNSRVYGATHMRFSNTEAGLTSASWVDYATGYAWTLIDADDLQTVYAQFSGTNGIHDAFDSITITRSTSNLKTIMVGSMSGDIAIDESNTNNFLTYGGITNPIVDGEQVYDFDGFTQYMQTGNIGITAYPFTFSAWIKPDTIAGTDAIMMMGNSATTTTYWGISLVAGKATIVGSNTTARTSSATATLVPGTWYHVVGVFASADSRVLYVNGAQVATNTTSVTFATTNQQVRVGSYVGSTLSNYFDGQMDGIRIYNKALTVPEIQTIYNARQPIQYSKEINVGDFVINNDAKNTYSSGVVLSNNIEGATHMRFSNTEAGLSSASWVTFATGYNWTLDASSSGNKFVYAEFSGNGRKGVAQDNIFLEIITDSTLKALLPGDLSGTTILDRSLSNNNFTNFGGITTIKDGGYRVFNLDGATEYMERGTIGITAYPFTFSAWIQPHTIAGTDAIVMMGNSATTNTYWGISLENGVPTIIASTKNPSKSTSTTTLVPGTWYHVVGVFASATSRVLYLNATQLASVGGNITFSATNQQVRVGRYVGTTTNYFDGNMDDVRIYSKALSVSEISALHQSRIDRALTPTATVTYDVTGATIWPVVATLTGFSESVTIVNNGGSNQYTFTQNGSFTFFFTNSAGNVGSAIASVDRITPTSGSLSISGPATLGLGSTMVKTSTNSLEKTFTGASEYFQVSDSIGSDAGYYTTLEMSNLQYNAQTIANTNMYVKTVGGITLLSGTANANVITSIGTTYTNISSPLTFIMRSAGSNGGKKGLYGAHLAIRVDIPAFQKAGNYTGTIIYTIY